MTYRTLEEKFLADYEELESERDALRARVGELEAMLDKNRVNMLLDAMVTDEGRKKVFDEYTCYSVPSTSSYEYGEWCRMYIDHDYYRNPKLPKGVSVQEFLDYFEREFEAAFEQKYQEEDDGDEGHR